VLWDNGNMNRKDAARHLTLSVRTLDKLAQEGEIPYWKLGSGLRSRVVYQRKDLDAYVERMRTDPRHVARKILEGA
jgi:excisionase family DNA binding protein